MKVVKCRNWTKFDLLSECYYNGTHIIKWDRSAVHTELVRLLVPIFILHCARMQVIT